ncbi:MAG: class I SAM-dependent methyltransferase [Vagococcus sp.]
MYNYYGSLASKVYDMTKPVGASINGDIDYYMDRLDGISGTILEAGVGTGRLLLPLLKEGFKVVGLDQSEEMLTKCRQNLSTHQLEASLHQGNLVDFDLGSNQFEAIIMPTSTFCLIESHELAMTVLKNFYRHLSPGGKVIIDLDLPFYPELNEVSTSSYEVNPEELITLERRIVEIDWLKQHTVSHLTYAQWDKGELVKQELQPFLLRWYGLNEFSMMLEAVGFSNISVSADYEFGVSPTDSNQTITFEAHK